MSETTRQDRGKRGARLRPDGTTVVVIVVILMTLTLGLIVPLFSVAKTTFSAEGLEAISGVLTRPVDRNAFGRTVILGLCVASVAVAIAFLMAYVQARVKTPFKRALHFITLMPMVSPPFAFATAVIVLFGRNGLITKQIFGVSFNIYGLHGMTLALSLSLFPVIYMSLLGMLQRLDASLDEAAVGLGARPGTIFRTVTVPLLLPGIGSGFLLVFVGAISDLGNALTLQGDFTVLASRIYMAVVGSSDTVRAAALSFMLFVPALTVFLLQRYWLERKDVHTVAGKTAGKFNMQSGLIAKIACFGAWFLALLILLIYSTILMGAFVKVPGVDWTFTFDNFKYVLVGLGSQAVVQSVTLASIAGPVAGVLGLLVAYMVVRRLKKSGPWLDFLAMLGIAVPGIVLGIGYVLAYSSPSLFLPRLAGGRAVAGGAIAILLVLIIRSTPAAVRTASGALRQLHPSLDEASISLGASGARTIREITIPLIRPAVVAGIMYAIARSITTLSPIILLVTPKTRLMSAQILHEVEQGRFGFAFAYCCVLLVVVTILFSIVQLLVRDPMKKVANRRDTDSSPRKSPKVKVDGDLVRNIKKGE